jgi:hypothetical protein
VKEEVKNMRQIDYFIFINYNKSHSCGFIS